MKKIGFLALLLTLAFFLPKTASMQEQQPLSTGSYPIPLVTATGTQGIFPLGCDAKGNVSYETHPYNADVFEFGATQNQPKYIGETPWGNQKPHIGFIVSYPGFGGKIVYSLDLKNKRTGAHMMFFNGGLSGYSDQEIRYYIPIEGRGQVLIGKFTQQSRDWRWEPESEFAHDVNIHAFVADPNQPWQPVLAGNTTPGVGSEGFQQQFGVFTLNPGSRTVPIRISFNTDAEAFKSCATLMIVQESKKGTSAAGYSAVAILADEAKTTGVVIAGKDVYTGKDGAFASEIESCGTQNPSAVPRVTLPHPTTARTKILNESFIPNWSFVDMTGAYTLNDRKGYNRTVQNLGYTFGTWIGENDSAFEEYPAQVLTSYWMAIQLGLSYSGSAGPAALNFPIGKYTKELNCSNVIYLPSIEATLTAETNLNDVVGKDGIVKQVIKAGKKEDMQKLIKFFEKLCLSRDLNGGDRGNSWWQ